MTAGSVHAGTDIACYSVESGGENPRGVHAIRVLSNTKGFTMDSLIAAPFDSYLTEEDLWQRVCADARRAGVTVYEYMETQATPPQRLAAPAAASDRLQAGFGSWKPPWGEINRYQRLTADIVQPFTDAGLKVVSDSDQDTYVYLNVHEAGLGGGSAGGHGENIVKDLKAYVEEFAPRIRRANQQGRSLPPPRGAGFRPMPGKARFSLAAQTGGARLRRHDSARGRKKRR